LEIDHKNDCLRFETESVAIKAFMIPTGLKVGPSGIKQIRHPYRWDANEGQSSHTTLSRTRPAEAGFK
jgi:hypothetical protein